MGLMGPIGPILHALQARVVRHPTAPKTGFPRREKLRRNYFFCAESQSTMSPCSSWDTAGALLLPSILATVADQAA